MTNVLRLCRCIPYLEPGSFRCASYLSPLAWLILTCNNTPSMRL